MNRSGIRIASAAAALGLVCVAVACGRKPAPHAAEVLEYDESFITEPATSPETTVESLPEEPPEANASSAEASRPAASEVTSHAAPPPPVQNKTVLQVPYISQKGILPNGCEAVSAVMLLHQVGDTIAPLDFVDRYLDCETVYTKNNTRYGPDPSKAYAGNPCKTQGGFGCFSPVIERALTRAIEAFAPGKYEVANLGGISLKELEAYIDRGIPAAIWATIGMQAVPFYYEWISPDDGLTYRYPAREHCLVLVGYDDNRYYFNDPYNSNGLVSYSKTTVEKRYETLGRQAVVIRPSSQVGHSYGTLNEGDNPIDYADQYTVTAEDDK